MSKPEKDIKYLIDNDKGLQSKRRVLVIVSLILLFVGLSGAKAVEANTFILKIVFTNQAAIGNLLFLSVLYLMVRYYGYAQIYYNHLYTDWTSRMLNDFFYHNFDPNQVEIDGVIYDSLPRGVSREDVLYNKIELSTSYICHFPFKRYIEYSWQHEHDYDLKMVSLFKQLSFIMYLKVLYIEVKYQLETLTEYRETLDIYAPYSIAVFAVICYLAPNYILSLFTYVGL